MGFSAFAHLERVAAFQAAKPPRADEEDAVPVEDDAAAEWTAFSDVASAPRADAFHWITFVAGWMASRMGLRFFGSCGAR